MEKKISKKTLNKSFRNWYYGHLTCFSQEHMQTFGYLCAMLPIIEELYKTKEEQKKAMQTYTAFFNTEPQVGSVVVGITASLEEAKANGADDINAETINGLRAGLMGPLAGKAIDFLVGERATAIRESIVMLGTIVIGAVAGTWINIRTGFTMTAEGADKPFLVLQDTLNGVFPNILSAVFVIFCWYLLTKRNMSPIYVMLLLVVIAFVGVLVGFFDTGLTY